jgi:hypothetical protein
MAIGERCVRALRDADTGRSGAVEALELAAADIDQLMLGGR